MIGKIIAVIIVLIILFLIYTYMTSGIYGVNFVIAMTVGLVMSPFIMVANMFK